MPGIFGRTINIHHENREESDFLSIHMVNPFHKRLDFKNSRFINSLVHFDFQDNYPFHFDSNHLEVWVYGDPLVDGLTGKDAVVKTIEIVRHSYPDFTKIDKIDGLFNILIYDKIKERLCIINDRNGLAHLYYGVFDGQLIWGSELRYFVNRKLETNINIEVIHDFLNLGYLINNETWFEEVKLLPPASYLEWDLNESAISYINKYWSHKNIGTSISHKSKKEIILDLKSLFQKAVEKRVGIDERIGITLSGGLDSRFIFANIPEQTKSFTAITRGMINSGDIKLAKQVTSLRDDCQHIIKHLNQDNWINNRIDGVIATSGQKNLFDMNALGSLPMHKDYFDINLDGAGGDGVFTGGGIKFENKNDLYDTFQKTYYRNKITDAKKSIEKLIDYYKSIESDQHFYIYERIRRFTVFGSILGHDYGIITRFPFLDNELQDYFYQLSGDFDANNLYLNMLVEYYPNYFKSIDTLDTGTRLYKSTQLNFIAKAINRLQEKIGYQKYIRRYHNYPKWLREGDTAIIDKYILDENLLIYEYVDYSIIKGTVKKYIETGMKAQLISRILSLSIFLENYKKLLRI